MLSLIVATAQNNAIGRNNELLWHISEDLKYFKSTTTSHPVIMGRKTYESIGRPLPGRRNIVITRGTIEAPQIKNPQTTSFEVSNNLNEVMSLAKNSENEFFVMGGGELYKQTFSSADRLYITKIYAEAEGADTFFPVVDEAEWKVVKESERLTDEENGIEFQFIVYEKR
jgi:dihydrofolate reductase